MKIVVFYYFKSSKILVNIRHLPESLKRTSKRHTVSRIACQCFELYFSLFDLPLSSRFFLGVLSLDFYRLGACFGVLCTELFNVAMSCGLFEVFLVNCFGYVDVIVFIGSSANLAEIRRRTDLVKILSNKRITEFEISMFACLIFSICF